MNATCSQIEQRVQQYLDRDLSELQQQALLTHLEQCQACRSAYGPLLEAIRDVEQAAAPQVPAGLLERVLEELPAAEVGPATQTAPIRRHPVRLFGWFSSVAAAAAILLVVVVARLWTGVPSDRPDSDQRPISMGKVDPQAVMLLASAACMAPLGGEQSTMALAASQAAIWHRPPLEVPPVRITLCMAVAPSRGNESDVPPVSDVLEMISNRAALHGGM